MLISREIHLSFNLNKLIRENHMSFCSREIHVNFENNFNQITFQLSNFIKIIPFFLSVKFMRKSTAQTHVIGKRLVHAFHCVDNDRLNLSYFVLINIDCFDNI